MTILIYNPEDKRFNQAAAASNKDSNPLDILAKFKSDDASGLKAAVLEQLVVKPKEIHSNELSPKKTGGIDPDKLALFVANGAKIAAA